MASISPRLTFAGLLLLSASPFSAACARSPASGVTVSLRPQWTAPRDQVVCTGACLRGADLDVTVWNDGRIVDGGSAGRVSAEDAARFSKILRPFRPVGKDATVDPSKLSQEFCPVKAQWPAGKRAGRPVLCGTYNGARDSLFSAVDEALRSIHIDIRWVGRALQSERVQTQPKAESLGAPSLMSAMGGKRTSAPKPLPHLHARHSACIHATNVALYTCSAASLPLKGFEHVEQVAAA
jgi:hypothetical protein